MPEKLLQKTGTNILWAVWLDFVIGCLQCWPCSMSALHRVPRDCIRLLDIKQLCMHAPLYRW